MRSARIGLLFILQALLALAVSAKDYKAGEIQSRNTYLYGRFECRMYAAEGGGMISAFFLYKPGSEQAQNSWEEVDIEVFGKNGVNLWQSNIITGNVNSLQRTEGYHSGSFNSWHTYTLEWTPSSMKWFVDGAFVREVNDSYVLGRLTSGQRICINLWAANIPSWVGNFETYKLPRYMFVQYVRHYPYQNGSFSSVPDLDDNFTSTNNFFVSSHTFNENYADFDPRNVGIVKGTLCLALTTAASTGISSTVPADGSVCNPVLLPARIEAEDFCSMSGVQVEPCAEGGSNVGWIDSGDTMTYSVDVPVASVYSGSFRLAARDTAPGFVVEKESAPGSNSYTELATLAGSVTGDWQLWATSTKSITLPAGTYKIRLRALTSGFNVNWFEFAAPPLNAYATWTSGWGLTGASAAPGANPSGDGVANLIKFAANLDPTRVHLPTLVSGTGTYGLPLVTVTIAGTPRLQVEFLRRRNATGLSYTVQFSDSLVSWVTSTATPVVSPIDSNWERVVVVDTVPATLRRFARVKVDWTN
jgi:hypothetical protein